MISLRPPKTDYTDYYDQSKFNLIWNFGKALIALLLAVTISNLSNSNYSIIPNLIAVGICIVMLLFLYFTRKYVVITAITVTSAFILVSLTYFLLENVMHYTTPLWMILNILIAYFVLGRFYGGIILAGHFIVFFFYISLNLEGNIESLPIFKSQDLFNFIFESFIIAIGIYYILEQYVKTTKHTENKMKAYNNELIEKNQLINTQNNEKEVMLREIHHRVKNNLQVITSILRLQSYDIQDDQHQKSFSEAINRVSSISLIHEKMYQSDKLNNFEFEDYFDSLALSIVGSYSYDKKITLDINAKLASVEFDSVVPIALLFNELVTNSIKHAFKDISNPKISVTFSRLNDEEFQLIYSDNGAWVESDHDTFGTEMIETMTEQLDGNFSVDKTQLGTTYSFVFRNIEEKN